MIHFIYEFLLTILIYFIFGQIPRINHLTFYTKLVFCFLRTMINIDLDFITLSYYYSIFFFITDAFLWRFFSKIKVKLFFSVSAKYNEMVLKGLTSILRILGNKTFQVNNEKFYSQEIRLSEML